MIICLWIFGKCTSLWSLWSTLWNVSEELSIVSIPLKTVERVIKTLTIFCLKRHFVHSIHHDVNEDQTCRESPPRACIHSQDSASVRPPSKVFVFFCFFKSFPFFTLFTLEAFPQTYIFLLRFLNELKVYFFLKKTFGFCSVAQNIIW